MTRKKKRMNFQNCFLSPFRPPKNGNAACSAALPSIHITVRCKKTATFLSTVLQIHACCCIQVLSEPICFYSWSSGVGSIHSSLLQICLGIVPELLGATVWCLQCTCLQSSSMRCKRPTCPLPASRLVFLTPFADLQTKFRWSDNYPRKEWACQTMEAGFSHLTVMCMEERAAEQAAFPF